MSTTRTSSETATRTSTLLSKVPEATAAFWVIKVLTTGMGEVVADDFAGRIGLLVTAVIGFCLMITALVWQFRQDRYRAWPYWTAAAMVSLFGTSVGDGPRRWLGLSFETTSIVFAVVVAAALGIWFSFERTLSIHSITSRRREIFYWVTVGATFALGTAVGDLATYLGSPFLQSALIFAAVMAVSYGGFRFLRLNGVFAFWFAYVMTRPLGASVADWSWVPKPFGAGLGKDLVSLITVVAFLGFLAFMAKTRNGEPKVLSVPAE